MQFFTYVIEQWSIIIDVPKIGGPNLEPGGTHPIMEQTKLIKFSLKKI